MEMTIRLVANKKVALSTLEWTYENVVKNIDKNNKQRHQ